MRVFLIRHAETTFNKRGIIQGHTQKSVLTDEGILEAKRLGERLKKIAPKLERVYSSDLKRARQTAEEISKPYGIPVVQDRRIREISMGRLEGMPYGSKEFLAYGKEVSSGVCVFAGYGAEARASVIERMQDFFMHLASGQNLEVAVVGHGEANALFLSSIEEVPAPNYNARRHEFFQRNCAITLVEHDGARFRVSAAFQRGWRNSDESDD